VLSADPTTRADEQAVSKIISPYPAYEGEVKLAANASWWRFRLIPNGDGNIMILQTDARGKDMTTATWCSWEFFDGENAVIDTGFDRPTKVRMTQRGVGGYIDVLHKGPPSPSPRWKQLTSPGNWIHPDDA
jgi:hypothetical protein